MKYKIKVNIIEKENSNIKGFANVVFGESFNITNIAILDGKNGMYVQMPRYRTNELDENGNNICRNFCNPITKEFREELYGTVLGKYKEAKNKNITEKQYKDKKSDITKKTGKKVADKTSRKTKKEEEKEDLADTPLKR